MPNSNQDQQNNYQNSEQNWQNPPPNLYNSNNSSTNSNSGQNSQNKNQFSNSQPTNSQQFQENSNNYKQSSNNFDTKNNPNFQNNPNFNYAQNNQIQGNLNQEVPNSYFRVSEPDVIIVENKVKTSPAWMVLALAKWWLILLIVLGLTLSVVGVYVIINQKPAEQIGSFNNVSATIEAPASLAKGIPENWKIIIENKENTAIQQLEIRLNFDKSFEFINAISPSPDVPRGDTY